MSVKVICLALVATFTGCSSNGPPADRPIPRKNEVVMAPGSRLTATTSVGTISILAGKGLRRDYTWDGATRAIEMEPRADRWYGSMGIYSVGFGDHWVNHNGITRGVCEEGQQHFDTLEDATVWLKSRDLDPHVWTNDGLVVGWSKSLPRRQLSVDVWQIYIKGKKPTNFPGGDDAAIEYEPNPLPME